jgi:predicted transcriptional regulator
MRRLGGEKVLCLRLPNDEYLAFDAVCKERGYSKTGKVRELIRGLVKEELQSVKLSAAEWRRIEAGIKEIARGEYATYGELKSEIRKKKMDYNKNRK